MIAQDALDYLAARDAGDAIRRDEHVGVAKRVVFVRRVRVVFAVVRDKIDLQ
jgi:hypothetical protein